MSGPRSKCEILQFPVGDQRHAKETSPVVIPSRVLTTVLFTDIVGSTERLAQLGDDSWRRLLDEHDRLAYGFVERHLGRVIKTTGDGILAIFDAPGCAIMCATGLSSFAADIGLRLRAGLHTGEVELRGDDIVGLTVNAAARILGEAAPGEILVSRVVTELVAGAGVRFSRRGQRNLRGLPGRWFLFAAE